MLDLANTSHAAGAAVETDEYFDCGATPVGEQHELMSLELSPSRATGLTELGRIRLGSDSAGTASGLTLRGWMEEQLSRDWC